MTELSEEEMSANLARMRRAMVDDEPSGQWNYLICLPLTEQESVPSTVHACEMGLVGSHLPYGGCRGDVWVADDALANVASGRLVPICVPCAVMVGKAMGVAGLFAAKDL